ncbi:3-oxoacyl-ACP reductase FabG [candidate division KSB1 bacterium]|nr:3-oxoacyl-ACP reductase FabG [candidate division KSB1 bacterium]
MKLKEKICLVTGGSRGIGRGIATILAEYGCSVAFTYNTNKELARKVEKDIKNNSGNARAFQMTIENRSSVIKTILEIQDHFSSHVIILINNAAIAQEKPFETITDSDWERMLKVNLQGPFICTQEVLPNMIKEKWGRIVNITSIGGQWGGFNQVHYAASKAALINFTQSIAKIYSRDGITSNAVAIGLAETDMSGPELDTGEGKNKVSNIPIGRVATVDEIANTVKFLCSDEASYITGQTINVNGGMYFG